MPFGKSQITGVVWDEFEKKNDRKFKLKNVLKKNYITPIYIRISIKEEDRSKCIKGSESRF